MKRIYCVKCKEEILDSAIAKENEEGALELDHEGLQDANTNEVTIKVFCHNCDQRYLLVYTLVAVRPI